MNLQDLEYLVLKREPFHPLEWVEHTNCQLRPEGLAHDAAVRVRYRAGGESLGYSEASNYQWHLVSHYAAPKPRFPNLALETLAKRDGKTNLIADFLEHLCERDVVLARWEGENNLCPCNISVHNLICDYFGIDPKAADTERNQLLDEYMKSQQNVPVVAVRDQHPRRLKEQHEPFQAGDIVRYGGGSTALARLSAPHAGGWHGSQCMGGSTFIGGSMYHATEEDLKKWGECAHYRKEAPWPEKSDEA